MKNYYEAIKQYITKYLSGNSKRMEDLEDIKNDQKELIKLYNDYKRLSNSRNEPIDESSKMTKSKFKEYIKEIITNTLNEATIDVQNPNNISSGDKQTLINTARVKTKNLKLGTPSDPVDFVESERTELEPNAKKYGNVKDVEKLEELEPNTKQKLKLANKELAFLAKQVRSLEKQLKSQGSDENEG